MAALWLGALSATFVARVLPPIANLPIRQRMCSHNRIAQVTSCARAEQIVDELLPLAALTKASEPERARLLELSEELEDLGAGASYLTDPTLLGNYEVAFYDRSVDGGRDGGDVASRRRPPRLLSKLFRMRGSFQHIVAPGKLVNFVVAAVCGIPVRVVALGSFSQLSPTELADAVTANGTQLSDDTVHITFEAPRIAIGGCCFELKGASAQPPVDLCVTYLDDRVRLGTASGGGRFIFVRGGQASQPWADEWRAVLDRPLTSARLLVAALGAVAIGALARPMLAAKAAYVTLGVGIGYAGTNFMKFAAGGGVPRLIASLRVRERLRNIAFRIDPSLAETSGQALSWKDVRGPSVGPSWMPKPPRRPRWNRRQEDAQ